MNLPRAGSRVRLLRMPDDPDPVPVGTEGTVTWVNETPDPAFNQIGVAWDNGSTLMLLPGVDRWEVIR